MTSPGGGLGRLLGAVWSRQAGKSIEALAAALVHGSQDEATAILGAPALSALAAEAYGFLKAKPPASHRVRFRQLPAPAGVVDGTGTTLVEIVNDDRPFLVDSILGEVQARGIPVRLVLHPILTVKRDASGGFDLVTAAVDRADDTTRESLIVLLLEAIPDTEAEDLVATLAAILDEVRLAVDDWRSMRARVDAAIAGYRRDPPPVAPEELAETIAFLEWLAAGSFTFLGMRELRLSSATALEAVPGADLGVLRNPDIRVLRRGSEQQQMSEDIRRFFMQPAPLILSKANAMARVHRRAHMDYVGVKSYAADGAIAGELRIVGLLTSSAYNQPVRSIPLLRLKAARLLAAGGYPPDSHNGKALINILDTFPRDELFQIGVDELKRWSDGILDLELRPQTRVFLRRDEFDRFVSALVYLPRERFNTETRVRIGAYLATILGGRVTTFTPAFMSNQLVRVHFIIGRDDGGAPRPVEADVEREVRQIVTSWEDRFAAASKARLGPAAASVIARHGAAFSGGYRENFSPERALEDLRRIDALTDGAPVAIDFYRDEDAPPERLRAGIYKLGEPMPLSDRVPVLENLGFRVIDERSYRITPATGAASSSVRLHDMALETLDGKPVEIGLDDDRLEQCFLAIARRDAENDGYNRLVKAAALDWRGAALFRAYGAYLQQIRIPFSQSYIAETLTRHAGVTADIFALFAARFLTTAQASAEAAIRGRIEHALEAVPSLDEDRILRHFVNLAGATNRTNFYQRRRDESPPETIAFKLNSAAVDGMPEPRPLAEIYVHGPRVEGVHLRFAPIARGGLRWSDRAQDFRTEVLGLVKAQQVKNTVIVPQGAKGGFLPKRLPVGGSRDAIQKEGIAAYELFVSTLLDLTDNLVDGRIVPPAGVVRHDGDDPYLVVAADKGTASFSDIANGISTARGFWLGDAFASGGSAGYDHKKMAITARGGWVCVKRHFRELDLPVAEPFDVVGVGDMSGDVFGNAMLLSDRIRLVAAFDHRDIFLDPDPDPASSHGERKRLFALPRSSWQDYDRAALSPGGGIVSRGTKSIPLSPAIRMRLGLEADAATPQQLMRAILMAKADLVWFGGIGTYVRATTETDADVGDRANDWLRVTAAEVGARVVGEGANLALTQRGRIELARRGVRLNTDFIDNSAGVNSSDQEVNIKIAFGPTVAAGRLPLSERNVVLAGMTDEVAANCLENNYRQSLAISLGRSRGLSDLGFQQRLMHDLADAGLLDRQLEFLPSDPQIADRARSGDGLTRPELAVLLSYAKIALSRQLIASTLPDDAYLAARLHGYFPATMQNRFAAEIDGHRLRREIIATELTNAVINRGGSTMIVRLEEETGHAPPTIVAAATAVEDCYRLEDLWRAVDGLDGRVKGELQLALYGEIQDLLRRQSAWMLRRATLGDGLGAVIEAYRPGIDAYRALLPGCLPERRQAGVAKRTSAFVEAGVPLELAVAIATLDMLADGADLAAIARASGRPVGDLAPVHARVGDHLRLGDLRAAAEALTLPDPYDRLAINSALSILSDAQRGISEDIAKSAAGGRLDFQDWLARHGQGAQRAKASLDEIADGGQLTVARLTVAASQVRDLQRN